MACGAHPVHQYILTCSAALYLQVGILIPLLLLPLCTVFFLLDEVAVYIKFLLLRTQQKDSIAAANIFFLMLKFLVPHTKTYSIFSTIDLL